MSPLIFVLASLAGGAGAALRYAVDAGVARIARRRSPWGIVIVNLTGSFALGIVTSALPDAAFVIGTGLLGGYTTFSTAMLDAIMLWRSGERPVSALHLLGTFAGCVIAALAGLAVGAAL